MSSHLLLLLLGYLCFCIAIDPIETSDWFNRLPELSNTTSYDNCTHCNEKQESSCVCLKYFHKCLVCCSSVSCCICEDCAPYWQEQQRLIIMTQIGISILFAFGIVGLIVVYCKICNRARQHTRTRRCIVSHEERDLTTHCSTIEDLRERPPSYNEVIRSASQVYTASCNQAPPLYTSPYNRMSMQEAPPSYPGTPKLQEKLQDSNEPPSSLPVVAQHI